MNSFQKTFKSIFHRHTWITILCWGAAFGVILMGAHGFIAPTHAKEQKQKTTHVPVRYAPESCDFEMTFPEAPLESKRCIPAGKCLTLVSYTMVYDLSANIDISANCMPSTPDDFKKYNSDVLKSALTGMADDLGISEYEMSVSSDDKIKSASVTGTGKDGTQEGLFTAQIWVGQNSILTVRAELVGGPHKQADESFSQILKSLKPRAETKEGPSP